MRKYGIALIKITAVCLIFFYLTYRALRGSALSELSFQGIRWSYIVAGCLLNFAATVITIVRWRALVQALGVPLSLIDSLKYGFIGFMFNLSPVGIVGGDAVKVLLLVKKTGASYEKATASVVIDRALGLYAMFLLGMGVVLATGFWREDAALARFSSYALAALTLATTIFFAVVAVPSSKRRIRERLAAKIPVAGPVFQKLVAASLEYSRRRKTLLYSLLATFAVHSGFALSLFCMARGIFRNVPTVVDHFILYCLGNVGSIIPLSAGPLEYFLDELYPLFSVNGSHCEPGCGMTVGVAFRIATILVAGVGVVFYFFSRSDVREARDNKETNV